MRRAAAALGLKIAIVLAGVAMIPSQSVGAGTPMTTEAMCREAYEYGFREVEMERTDLRSELEMRRTLMNLRLEAILDRERVREDIRPGIREGCGIYLSGATDFAEARATEEDGFWSRPTVVVSWGEELADLPEIEA